MGERYADIIIDVSAEKLDRTFQYRVPDSLTEWTRPGAVVEIPFGKSDRVIRGYVLRVSDKPQLEPEKIKSICRIVSDPGDEDSKLISLALWMRDYYGATTLQALRTVLPARTAAGKKERKKVVLALSADEAGERLALFRKKNQKARVRILEALLVQKELPWEIVTGSLRIPPSTLKDLREQGVLKLEQERILRTPDVIKGMKDRFASDHTDSADSFELTPAQKFAVEEICRNWETEPCGSFLLHGVTGSGKTEVYMEVIARALAHGQQAILLIPEISLTYQNVLRFYRRFGDRISVLHSRLSPAERQDQFERARSGEIDIMIGPRSALFTPFPRLGVIIIDEEHENSYRSEAAPRYHARETAGERARLEKARLVLGSATPSIEAFYRAEHGIYRLLQLPGRAGGSRLPEVHTVDLRAELRAGNRSVISRVLAEKIRKTLDEGHQVMLFLNRRGYTGFLSCRVCGHVVKCPHCDVSLTLHRNGKMICHYCGYERPLLTVCPECGSEGIGGFGTGTQQVEQIVSQMFPDARILRMDADTTRGKDGHAEILRSFGRQEADILIGTQMIIKGHDFPQVTLMGILLADMSLHAADYRAAEHTFQLLTQACGRAGRGTIPGEVVIQTYTPDHYAVVNAAAQDYQSFYEQEILFRRMSGYPPAGGILGIHCMCEDQKLLETAADFLGRFVRAAASRYGGQVLGPVDERISRIRDVYRKVLYVKGEDDRGLTSVKNMTEQYIEINEGFSKIRILFEMN